MKLGSEVRRKARSSSSRSRRSGRTTSAIASGLVYEAVALGYPEPRLGEGIALIVRPDRREQEEALRAFLKRQLPNFMQPGPIIWRDELPRSPNGKLDRVELKNELTA